MQVNMFLFVIQYIIFCQQYKFIFMNPFIGNNIIRDVENNDFPFVVSLIHIENEGTSNETLTHGCTGTLISKMDVATSAHCLLNEFRNSIKVVVGSNDFKLGQRHTILWWLTYDQWAYLKNITIKFLVNDIGNIRLIHEVPQSIRIIPLSKESNYKFYGKQVVSAGWGNLNNTNVDSILKTVKLKVLTNAECINKVSNIVGKRMLLDPKEGLCTVAQPYILLNYGDSGGPLLFRNKLIGINKGTVPDDLNDGDPNLTNIHVAVEYYKGFMYDIIDCDLI